MFCFHSIDSKILKPNEFATNNKTPWSVLKIKASKQGAQNALLDMSLTVSMYSKLA